MSRPDVALITGCGSGIGKALARDLNGRKLPNGDPAYIVYATDIRVDPMKELELEGINIALMDVTKMPMILELVKQIMEKHGHIDLLVTNAGINGGGFLADMDYRTVEKVFDVNVHGMFRTIQAVVPHMLAARSGKIATLCSVNSYFTNLFAGPYCGTKAAIERMTESLSMEVTTFGVHVTSVVPGWVRTGIADNGLTDYSRYESPDSYYHPIVDTMKKWANLGNNRGMPVEQAVREIGDGLSKEKPPRFLYTGESYIEVIWRGFLQNWVCNNVSAKVHLSRAGFEPLIKANAERKALAEGKLADKSVPLSLQKEE